MPSRAPVDAQPPHRPAGLRLRRVLFMSQRRAERMRPPLAAAMISITDPHSPQAVLRPGWSAVLRVAFTDTDPASFADESAAAPGALGADEVAQIAAFAAQQARRCSRIVVHCRHGVSRSAAVARAVCEAASLPFPAAYDSDNRFVYLALRGATRFALRQGEPS